MEEKKLVPKLRFPGFTEPWEQRKGDEIFISVSDKGYPQLPVLSASQELGMVYRDENGIDIHHNKSNEDTYKRVLPGQFVIHLRSFQGGFAYSNVEGITSPAYTVITFKNPELYYGLFWKQVFKSLTFIKHLETITYGIRDGRSISFSDFRSLKLCYPTYGEQKFIGDGLEKTDNLITLHQRKLEHLKLKKKSLLQKLFPKEGEVYPELRFPGFTDPWEQRKFRSLFQKNLERNDGQFPFNKTISISRMIYSESGNGASTESLDNYKVLRVGDIAFEGHENKDFKFGRFVMNDVGNGIMSPRFTVLRPLIDMELNFWKEYINYEPIMQKKLVYSTKKGTMMNELVVEDFLNQYVAVPSVQEQQKIGYLLKCMTDDITLHQRKLEHLQLLKKALLQQLFV